MKTNIIFFLTLIAVFSSCKKEDENTDYNYEAIVVYKVNDGMITCDDDLFSLKFIKGIHEAESIIDSDSRVLDSIYVAVNLPDELKEIGLTIKLDVRVPEPDETPSCYNFEMPVLYGPTVYVVRAEKK